MFDLPKIFKIFLKSILNKPKKGELYQLTFKVKPDAKHKYLIFFGGGACVSVKIVVQPQTSLVFWGCYFNFLLFKNMGPGFITINRII